LRRLLGDGFAARALVAGSAVGRAALDRVGAALGAVSAVGGATSDRVGAAAGACGRRLRTGFTGAVTSAGVSAWSDAGAAVVVEATAARDAAVRARRALAGFRGAAADLDSVRPPARDRPIAVSAWRAASKEAISARTSTRRASIAAVISCIFGMSGIVEARAPERLSARDRS
jgi:hypothetical protein